MTREEAIKHFESYIGNECYTHSHQEACRLAVAALRAQQAPAKLDRSRWEGCKYRQETAPKWCLWKFCPDYGKPLTEEAWAELERRIGGNNETG